jgi:hypothetical protein
MRKREVHCSKQSQLVFTFQSERFWFYKSLQLKFLVEQAETRLCFKKDSSRRRRGRKTDSTSNKKIPKIGKAILKSFSCFLKLSHELLAI